LTDSQGGRVTGGERLTECKLKDKEREREREREGGREGEGEFSACKHYSKQCAELSARTS
jgi:hypothetical protein